MTKTGKPQPGDLLEFFDGEKFVLGTYREQEHRDTGIWLCLRVDGENEWIHRTDVVSIIKRRENRDTQQ